MSTKIRFAKGFSAVTKGARTVLVLGPAPSFSKAKLPKMFAGQTRELLLELAKDLQPGDQGAIASTLTGTKPHRLILGVLPNNASRYNHPAHPEGIVKILSSAGIAADKHVAVVLMLDKKDHLVAALNAIGRAFPLYSAKSKDSALEIRIASFDTHGKPIEISKLAKSTMEAAREVARLVDSPPSEMNPEALAKEARALLRGLPVKTKVIVGTALQEHGLGGIYGVGKAALTAPRMLIASYKPRGKSKKHIALVGKGVTFDTGGLHLKPRGFMETMKMDMGGSAAVLGAFKVLVENDCPHPVSLVLCLAENAIGPGSYKPDDILTMHSGKTVEINNTDAEGRLLLADGVSYAARKLKADIVIDAATLTGAQLIALGSGHAAIMSNDDGLETALVSAGKKSGDLAHALPFCPEFYKSEFKSPVADMRNSVKNRMNAQSSCAAQFVYNHIEDTPVKWGHIDLAGPAFRSDRGTGYGVALLSTAVLGL